MTLFTVVHSCSLETVGGGEEGSKHIIITVCIVFLIIIIIIIVIIIVDIFEGYSEGDVFYTGVGTSFCCFTCIEASVWNSKKELLQHNENCASKIMKL